jgi:hypothetical protein
MLNVLYKLSELTLGEDIPYSKPKYREIRITDVDPNDQDYAMTPKIDGAHGYLILKKHPELYSYREGKRNKNIEHTDKVEGLRNSKVPKYLQGKVLRVEIHGQDHQGNQLPAETIGGMLNSKQKDWKSKGKLQVTPIDTERTSDFSMFPEDQSFSAKEELFRSVASKIPGVRYVPAARTPEDKRELLDSVITKRHPLTDEGVVLHPEVGRYIKAKVRPDFDVYIRGVTPGKKGAAGFTYSWSPDSAVVGNVGTGFTQEQRDDMLRNIEKYVGKKAIVHARKQFASGALGGSPSYYRMHLDNTEE